MKRVIVAGSRDIEDYAYIKATLDFHFCLEDKKKLTILHGNALGVDQLAERWCDQNKVTYERWHADWDTHGKKAGILRNAEMVNDGKASMLIAVWDGLSPGTKSIIDMARKKGLQVIVKLY